jgi:hypothetical protein
MRRISIFSARSWFRLFFSALLYRRKLKLKAK